MTQEQTVRLSPCENFLCEEHSVRKPEKFILDATAGFRMMWFNKHHPNCIYLDQRPECEPDVVGDFRDLKQFPNEPFKLIVFDPPHDIRNGPSDPNSQFIKHFGWLEPETWASDLKKGLAECYGVLAPYGVLIFKWGTHCKSLRAIKPLFPTAPLFSQCIVGGAGERGKNQTWWFCFMKIPEEEKP